MSYVPVADHVLIQEVLEVALCGVDFWGLVKPNLKPGMTHDRVAGLVNVSCSHVREHTPSNKD